MPKIHKRRPKGDEHSTTRAGVWYRLPLYKDSHLAMNGGDDQALCGRLLLVDELWWIDSGWEEEAGELFLVTDERKQGKCTKCKSLLKDRQEGERFIDEVKGKKHPSPFDEQERALLRARSAAERLRMRSLGAWVAREFGGEVIG